MPFIPALNTAKVTVGQTLHGQTVHNVFHVQAGGPWDAASLDALCDIFIAWWNNDLAPLLSANIQLQGVSARDLTIEDGLGVEVGAPAASGGDLVGPAMPGNVALAVKLKSGYTGRNRNGRSFLAGLTEGQQEGNEVTLATRDGITAAYQSLIADLNANATPLVVASFYDGTALVEKDDGRILREPTPRAAALLTPVLDAVANVALDSQRRRLQGRGI